MQNQRGLASQRTGLVGVLVPARHSARQPRAARRAKEAGINAPPVLTRRFRFHADDHSAVSGGPPPRFGFARASRSRVDPRPLGTRSARRRPLGRETAAFLGHRHCDCCGRLLATCMLQARPRCRHLLRSVRRANARPIKAEVRADLERTDGLDEEKRSQPALSRALLRMIAEAP